MVTFQPPGAGGPGQPAREADAPLRGGPDAARRAKHESVRLNYGSLYAVVESLEKNGFVKATGTVQEGRRPQRTVYEITDAGLTEMTDWLTELIGTPSKEYPAFMAGLSFIPALDPDDALAALRRRAEALVVKLVSLRGVEKAAREAGLPRIFGLEAEYEEQQLAAELKFVNGPRRRDAERAPSRGSTCGGTSSPTSSTPRRCTSPSSSPTNTRKTRSRVLRHAAPGPDNHEPGPRGTVARGCDATA